MSFSDVFAEDKAKFDRVIGENAAEKMHIERCLSLSRAIRWKDGTGGKVFENMLGAAGSRIFSGVLKRLNLFLQKEEAGELRDRRGLISKLMFVHDLGKFNRAAARFDGSGHEERSAEIVAGKREILVQDAHWKEENVDLLADLVRYHGHLGITHIGEASIVFLNPLLVSLSQMPLERRRLFLDLLIVLTCCDAGASGDFAANRFYLDHGRVKLYESLADELLALSAKAPEARRPGSPARLLKTASDFGHTAVRIRRIVTSSNRMSVSQKVLESALRDAWASGSLNPVSLAVTRFDHGAYVFEPLLTHLIRGDRRVSPQALKKLLFFIGILCRGKKKPTVIRFRESFSVKEDMRRANEDRFRELAEAVDRCERKEIEGVLKKHKPGTTPAV